MPFLERPPPPPAVFGPLRGRPWMTSGSFRLPRPLGRPWAPPSSRAERSKPPVAAAIPVSKTGAPLKYTPNVLS